MKKEIVYVSLFCVLVSFVFGADLNHDTATITTNCTVNPPRFVTGVNNNSYVKNEVYDNTNPQDCSVVYTFASSYDMTHLTIYDLDDGSGGDYTITTHVYIDGTEVCTNTTDSAAEVDINCDFTATSDVVDIRFVVPSYCGGNCGGNAWGVSEINMTGTGAVAGVTPSLSLASDLVNSTVSNSSYWNFYFNGTSVNNSDIYNCDFKIQNTVNESQTSIDLGSQQNFTINFTYSDTWLNLSINCSNENASDEVSAMYFIDDIQPIPLISVSNASSFYDNTNLDISVNCSDTNLFAINTTIRDSTNSLEYHGFNTDLTVDFFQQNITNSTSTLGADTYTLETYCWDSHTSYKLKHKPTADDNGIYYNGLRFYCEDAKKYEYHEKRDKVKFKVKFNNKNTTHFCYFEGSEFINIPHSQYPNHWVSLSKRVWLDDYEGIITQEGDKLKVIYQKDDEFDNILTESIGDLNEAYQELTFYIIAAPTLDQEILESLNQNTSLILAEVEDISGDLEMLYMVILWLGLWGLGYHSYTNFNQFMGAAMIILTVPINLYFLYAFRETLRTGTGFIGIGFGIMFGLTFGILLFLKGKKQKSLA